MTPRVPVDPEALADAWQAAHERGACLELRCALREQEGDEAVDALWAAMGDVLDARRARRAAPGTVWQARRARGTVVVVASDAEMGTALVRRVDRAGRGAETRVPLWELADGYRLVGRTGLAAPGGRGAGAAAAGQLTIGGGS